jgi:hypothetical protein
MAQPGESFPQQFALGILNLAQQRKIKQAELEDMRSARAASNFLAQEHIDLAERAQSLAEFNSGVAAKDRETQAEIQKAAALARIKIETDKIAREREGVVVQNLSNFARTGSAFIPSYARDKIPELTSSNSSEFGIATVEIPGLGTLIQKISDPHMKLELEKTQAEIGRFQQQKALDAEKTKLTAEKSETERQKRNTISGRIGGQALQTVNQGLADMTQSAQRMAFTLSLSGSAEDREKAKRIALDPAEAFKGNEGQLSLYNNFRLVQQAVAEDIARGIDVKSVKTDLQATDAAGVTQAIMWQPPEKVQGKFAGRAAGGSTAYKVLLSNNKVVEVDRETYNSLSPGDAFNPSAPSGTPSAAPSGPASTGGPSPGLSANPPPKVSPERAKAITAEFARLKAIYVNTRDPALYEKLAALANELGS